MFQKLQSKWGVSLARVILILLTFTIGGAGCAQLGRYLMSFTGLERATAIYWICYIPVMTIIWPLCVLVVSIFTGQFNFFRKYLSRMGRRMFSRRKNTGSENTASFTEARKERTARTSTMKHAL